MLYRIFLGFLLLVAILLTLNEHFQQRRAEQMAAGGAIQTSAATSGAGYPNPVFDRNASTVTPIVELVPTPDPGAYP